LVIRLFIKSLMTRLIVDTFPLCNTHLCMYYTHFCTHPFQVNGSKRLKYYVTMAGPDVLAVSTSATCQDIVKRKGLWYRNKYVHGDSSKHRQRLALHFINHSHRRTCPFVRTFCGIRAPRAPCASPGSRSRRPLHGRFSA